LDCSTNRSYRTTQRRSVLFRSPIDPRRGWYERSSHPGAAGDQEVGVLVSVGGGSVAALGAGARSAAAPGGGPGSGTPAREGRAVGAFAGAGGLYRCVARGGGTAAVGGAAGPSVDGLSAGVMGNGRTIEGSGVEGTLAGTEVVTEGAEVVTEGAEVTGVKTSTVGGGSALGCPVKTSNPTPVPAAARQPMAASGLAHRTPAQRRWPLARRRNASQGSAGASSGTPAGGSGISNCAALATGAGAAASLPIRSRRERSSSIVRIWSLSGSSTTSYNELPDLLGTGFGYFHGW
jgi:hypothetical protein